MASSVEQPNNAVLLYSTLHKRDMVQEGCILKLWIRCAVQLLALPRSCCLTIAGSTQHCKLLHSTAFTANRRKHLPVDEEKTMS